MCGQLSQRGWEKPQRGQQTRSCSVAWGPAPPCRAQVCLGSESAARCPSRDSGAHLQCHDWGDPALTQKESECRVVSQWGVCVWMSPRSDMFEQMVYVHASVQEEEIGGSAV